MTITEIHDIASIAVKNGWPESEVTFAFATIARNAKRKWANDMLDEVVRSHNSVREKIGFRRK